MYILSRTRSSSCLSSIRFYHEGVCACRLSSLYYAFRLSVNLSIAMSTAKRQVRQRQGERRSGRTRAHSSSVVPRDAAARRRVPTSPVHERARARRYQAPVKTSQARRGRDVRRRVRATFVGAQTFATITAGLGSRNYDAEVAIGYPARDLDWRTRRNSLPWSRWVLVSVVM